MVLPTMDVYTILPTNIGPLTTTFTPPATCTGLDVGGRGNEAFFLGAEYLGHVKCSTNVLDECRPLPPTSKGIQDLINIPDLFLTYHSPGVICPSGWSTAASYDRAQPTDVTFRPENYMDRLYKSVWPLEKSETLILCCPENFVAADYLCIGPAAASVNPSFSGYCTTGGEGSFDASELTDGRIPSIPLTTATVLLSDTHTTGQQLRPAFRPIVMVHKATDMAQHAATTTTSAASPAKTTAASEAKETGAAGTKKSSASSFKTSIGLMAAFAVAAMFA